jgi:hypothetical protein
MSRTQNPWPSGILPNGLKITPDQRGVPVQADASRRSAELHDLRGWRRALVPASTGMGPYASRAGRTSALVALAPWQFSLTGQVQAGSVYLAAQCTPLRIANPTRSKNYPHALGRRLPVQESRGGIDTLITDRIRVHRDASSRTSGSPGPSWQPPSLRSRPGRPLSAPPPSRPLTAAQEEPVLGTEADVDDARLCRSGRLVRARCNSTGEGRHQRARRRSPTRTVTGESRARGPARDHEHAGDADRLEPAEVKAAVQAVRGVLLQHRPLSSLKRIIVRMSCRAGPVMETWSLSLIFSRISTRGTK